MAPKNVRPASTSNFRATYYASLGFHGVKVKELLEEMLKEPTVDIARLTDFCFLYGVPIMYRSVVWKLIMGVLPACQSSWEYIEKTRDEEWKDIFRTTLSLMDRAENSTLAKDHLVFALDLINGTYVPRDTLIQDPRLLSMADAFCEIVDDDDQSTFWLYRAFVQHLLKHGDSSSYKATLSTQVQTLAEVLSKEDPTLEEHFNKLGVSLESFATGWFASCFAQVLPINSLDRIWDRMIVFDPKYNACFALALIIQFKKQILAADTAPRLKKVFENIATFDCDSLLVGTLDLFKRYIKPDLKLPDW